MRFVSWTSSSNPDYNGDIDYAAIEVGVDAAKQILARYAVFTAARAMDRDLYDMYYWDGGPDWFGHVDDATEAWFAKHEDVEPPAGEILTMDDGVTFDGLEFQRVECVQMIICEDGVRWTAIPKHTSLYVTTETIPIATIREIAEGR